MTSVLTRRQIAQNIHSWPSQRKHWMAM
uniref:Uncharacterized protein n=1 Tax=Arundo donax TaxID=35708 RepID=A0A0A8YSC9_ARUDO